jgi:hypothetical protein
VTRSGRAGGLRLIACLILGLSGLAVPASVLAARKWTLVASPTSFPAGTSTAVTLTVQNVGSSSGGDEITCVRVAIPTAFAVTSASVVSVKGVTDAASHGWVVVTGSATGQTIATFKNPSDKNPLVGLPIGDRAVFRIVGAATASGSLTWTSIAADKPGGATSTSCGSGTFATISLTFSVGGAATPTPTPTPTPTRTPIPAPSATPKPTPTPTPVPPTASPASTSTPGAPAPSDDPATPSGSAAPSPPASRRDGDAVAPPMTSTPTPGPGGPGTGGQAPGAADGVDVSVPRHAPGDGREVVGGLNATVRTALIEMGLVGWTIPAVALGIPGLLVVVVVALQLVGGMAWLPVARRLLSRASPEPAHGRSDLTRTRRRPRS